MTENERTLRALLADACRDMGSADPDRLAKRLANADVLAVTSISEAVADAAVEDIAQLLGNRWGHTAPSDDPFGTSRRPGQKLLEVLKRLAAGRVNPGTAPA
jgi:hypothetical protein